MRYLLLLLTCLTLFGCQDTNSNSDDKMKYGDFEITESDPNFRPAYNIIMNRCVNCHDGYHNNWANNTSNAHWIADGKIIKNNSANSEFIQRIINSGFPASSMPIGGSALPAAEYDALKKWIDELP